LRLAARQGIAQQMRNALLYGFNNANSGEGLLNTAGATTVTLPADSNGNTTLSTWDSGQLAQFFLNLIGSLKVRTLQIGQPLRLVFLACKIFVVRLCVCCLLHLCCLSLFLFLILTTQLSVCK
jgi:hypothetical protein